MAKQSTNFKVLEHPAVLEVEQREAILSDPGFGSHFTDHMAVAFYSREDGWHNATISPHDELRVPPSMMVFHYGQAIFEGLKAYRTPDNELVMFRPEMNAERFNISAKRMAMPEIPEKMFIEACEKLVIADRHWVPEVQGQSLYLRPFMVASEAHLGLRASNEYLFMVIASPVAPFFSAGNELPAISIFATEQYVRATQGGTGYAKCAGNYAASLVAKDQAQEYDCQDVLWRDAKERKFIEEMGTSNICFVERSGDSVSIVTPPISDTILNGITRDSVLKLAKDFKFDVEEVPCVFEEIIAKIESGVITEAFSCGTAVTLTPIGNIVTPENKTAIGNGKAGEITLKLREKLIDIQFGREKDKHKWSHAI